jgi:hypothetical protein
MKLKQILKKAWLPALTVLAICAGAVILNATIRTSEAMQLEQTAMNAAEAPEETAATEAPGEGTVETAVATPTIAPSDTSLSASVFKPSGDYSYIELESDSTPGAQDLSSFEAGRTVAGMMEAVFGESFTSGSHDIYVRYGKTDGSVSGSYSILVGSRNWSEATFFGSIDAVSGVVRTIEKLTPESQQVRKSGDDFNNNAESLMMAARDDMKLTDTAKNLIMTQIANGRTIEEAMTDGIQVDFNDPDIDVVADCKVRMSSGDCYLVRMAYPTCEIVMFETYSLGWDACLYGYWNEADKPDFTNDGSWQTAEGIEAAAEEAPRPTPNPAASAAP